jgi:hypothetical protein
VKLNGQQSNTLFLMHDLPQSNLVNPAVQIPCKLYIGMPLLNSLHFNYSNTYFSYNDLFTSSGKTNLGYLANKTNNTNVIAVEADINILSFGYKYKKYYFTFNVTERFGIQQNMPGSFFDLIINGNTAHVGEKVDLSGIRFNGSWYREWALGVSKEVNDNWTIGGRAKLLFGKASLRTSQSDFTFSTNSLPYPLYFNSAFTINTSGPVSLTQDANGTITGTQTNFGDPVGVLLNSQNKGAAFDIGFIYKYDNNITLSGSLLDLGLIRWSSDVTNLNEKGNITFNGLSSNGNNNGILDNLRNNFTFTQGHKVYYTATNPKLFLGSTYKIYNWLNVGLVSRSELYPGYWHQSFTASANANFNKILAGSLSWSYLNNSIANIGTGIGMRTPTWGWYAVSDNTLGFIKYLSARNINLRIGFYAMFGCASRNSKAISPMRGCQWLRDSETKHFRIKSIIDRLKKKKK